MINENETTESLGPITISFGKFQGPHIGHHAAAQFGKKYASDNGMEFRVYTSNRHMKKLKTPRPYPETPLSPEQKAKHLPIVLGVDKVHFEESPYSTIEKLLAAGHSHVHIILGSDRMEDTAPGLIEKYGDRVVPVQFGEKRSESSKGLAGASSTKMREHARTNNFEAFKGILPGHVSEEHAREMFNNIRGGLAAAKQKLDEEVSAQTRMKLSRIAKRTAKLRAAKRKARQRRRRNIKQLKGRAKQDIKNQLRHRYFKGTWQKLGFSTRARIDANVNKRKKIADSMVRRILPDVVRGENERLKRVSLRRESIEDVLLPLLLEARIGSKKAGSGPGANSASSRAKARMRKQKQRGKIKSSKKSGNITGHYAVVRATSGKYAGDVMVVDKSSYDPNQHEVVVAPDKFSISSGQKILDDADFIQTDSSIKLYGNQKGAKVAKLGKPKKAKTAEFAEKKKKTPTQQQKAAQDAMMPAEPGKWDPTPGTIVAKRRQGKHDADPTSHDASTFELGMIAYVNMALGMDPKTQVEQGMMSEEDMMKVIKNPHQSFAPACQRVANAVISKYGPDITMQSTGKTIEGVELSKEAQAAGLVSKTAKTDSLVKRKSTGETIARISVKAGDETQGASGNWQDTNRGLQVTVDLAREMGIKVPEKAAKKIKEMQKFLASDEYGGTNITTAGPTELYTVGGSRGVLRGEDKAIEKKEKANVKLSDMFSEFTQEFPELAAVNRYVQTTGIHKFDQNSPAVADTLLAMSLDGSQVKIAPITIDLMKKIKTQLVSRFKSNRVKGNIAEEKEVQRLIKLAEQKGKKLEAEELRKRYAYRNTARMIMETHFGDDTKTNESYNGIPVTKLDGFQLLKLLIENAYEDSEKQVETPQISQEELKANLEGMAKIAEEDPLGFFEIMYPLFEYEMTPTTIDWLDYMSPDGYTTNKVYINGKEILIPVEMPINYPAPGMEVPGMNMKESLILEKRNYRKEYDNYHSKPEQRKNRAGRVKARRLMMKLGKVRKGDGKDVDHKDSNPKNNGKHNLRVRSKSENRADND